MVLPKIDYYKNLKFGEPSVCLIEFVDIDNIDPSFKYKREYFSSIEEFFDCLETLFGSFQEDMYLMNKAYFILLWEGLNRSESRELKIQDVEINDKNHAKLHLKNRDIIITNPLSIKYLKDVIDIKGRGSGYDIITANGRGRSFKYADTGMVLRNTSKNSISSIPESSINKICSQQIELADNLPEENEFYGKRLVYRALSNNLPFIKLMEQGIKNKVTIEQLEEVKQEKIIAQNALVSFSNNYTGWLNYYGYND